MPSPKRRLDEAKPLYILPDDNLPEEVLIPAFAEAARAQCMVGFFTSASLSEIAAGLATYLQNPQAAFRLIVSPYLTEGDQHAMIEGSKAAQDLATSAMDAFVVTSNDLQTHTLRCLSVLLSQGRLEFRIALMKDALFHPKVWLFEVDEGLAVVHGSGNMTASGMRRNKEQVTVSRAWQDPNQSYIANKLRDEFERLWRNGDETCLVVNLPDAIEKKLLQFLPSGRQPTEDDFRSLFARASAVRGTETPTDDVPVPERQKFQVPTWLNYREGIFAHQGAAVDAWVSAGFRGTLEMATGSGKTLTAMIGAHHLYQQEKPLLVAIAAPYVPLIQQWCDEVAQFGVAPINLTIVGNASSRAAALSAARRRLRLGLHDIEVAVVSHDTLCTPEFQHEISLFECSTLLIADEAHNLGRSSFRENPPDVFQHRLALSATPVRQYDPEGTGAIFAFFGPVVFSFTLKQAIGTCLVPYDYFVHPVRLTQVEMDEWLDLTDQIKRNAWRSSSDSPDEFLAKLMRDRRALLETASEKIGVLDRLMAAEGYRQLKHTLVYTSDKDPRQMDAVNALLRARGVLFHQLTDQETGNRAKTAQILRSFMEGDIQVLTAKRVLDEGVNIPQIRQAYILASTTVERQWVQRRGRVLRLCPEIGKDHSVVRDLLALPPSLDGLDADAKGLVKSELRRAQEFASLARNAGLPGGALEVLHPLIEAVMM